MGLKELFQTEQCSDFLIGTEGYLENGDFIRYFDEYVLINEKRYDKYISCPIYEKKLRVISSPHLWKNHNLTLEEFKSSYPNHPLQSAFSSYLHCVKDSLNEDHDIAAIDLNYKERALSYYGEECMWCGEDDIGKLCVHHKDEYHSGEHSYFSNNNLENLIVLCTTCHSKRHNKENKGFWTGKSKIEEGFMTIISGLYEAYGLDYKDVNLRDTPSRVARSFLEMLQGIDTTRIEKILRQNFPSLYNGMVVLTEIPCFSMCPHHFLPVRYNAHFGYIPYGRVLGLSKIPRYIKAIVQAPRLQEDVTEQIVDMFMQIVKPMGCMVILKGQHMCMGCRGVEMPDVSTITSALRGNFEELTVREEFFKMIDLHSTKS